MFDMHNDTAFATLNEGAATAASFYSKYIDLAGYEGALFLLMCTMGTADSSNTFTPALYGCANGDDPSSSANYTALSGADLHGAFAVMNDTTSYSQKVGYAAGSNSYRYICVRVVEAGTAVATTISIGALVGRGRHKKISADSLTTGTVT